ncbi:TRAP transporter small permease [Marispirochaeta aestuarii]|uniref:TRAP transporter small permease n=1 Tax=Marispirochaeta aestuarii TaxID=1963862 RepID=UPI0029C86504|nr:TRAP transporter small permease [Marispirochaeta aestuarii]
MFTKILDVYARIINAVIILLMYLLMFSVALQIMGRYIHFIPRYLWAEEVARMSLIWVIFLGSMIGLRERRHFYVDFLPRNLSPKVNLVLDILYYVLLFAVSYIFLRFGFRYWKMGTIQQSELTGINLGWIHASVPFAGFTWTIFLIEQVARLITGKGLPKQQEPEEGELP